MTDTILLNEQTIGTFLDALASHAPTPGGGSVAALTGAMAAGLLTMVGAIMRNAGKKQPPETDEELRAIQTQAEKLRQELQQLAQRDVDVFRHLSAAYKLPRMTDADAASRKAAIQKLTQQAAEVPLQTAYAAASLLTLCTALAQQCGRLVASDVGVAALLARAAVQSALLSVEINLSNLDDRLFIQQTRTKVQDLTMGLEEATTRVLETVYARIQQ